MVRVQTHGPGTAVRIPPSPPARRKNDLTISYFFERRESCPNCCPNSAVSICTGSTLNRRQTIRACCIRLRRSFAMRRSGVQIPRLHSITGNRYFICPSGAADFPTPLPTLLSAFPSKWPWIRFPMGHEVIADALALLCVTTVGVWYRTYFKDTNNGSTVSGA